MAKVIIELENSYMDVIEKIFCPLYGQLCWGVKRGHGAFLTFEFGEPKKVPKNEERRIITVDGEWHLWIYRCEWVIFQGWQAIADWRSSTDREINRAIEQLDGQKHRRIA